MSLVYDTLAYDRTLRQDDCFTEKQAEALRKAADIHVESGLATKADIAKLETKLIAIQWLFGAMVAFLALLTTLVGIALH